VKINPRKKATPAKNKEEITLKEDGHIYEDKKGHKYTSVSKIIKKFSHVFDADGLIAMRVAKRRGITVQEIKSEWQKIASDSMTKGKEMHKILEAFINDGKRKKRFENLLVSFENLNLQGELYTEKKIHNLEEKIAGTPDLREKVKNKLNLYDFKTNKAIDYTSLYDDWMKPPIDFLEDCLYNKYSLQLSLYAWMEEQNGEKIGKLSILWIDSRYNIHVIPVMYMKNTVETILNYIKKNNVKF